MKNPVWCRDELLIALDFYFRHFPSFPSKGSPEIAELSHRIRHIGELVYSDQALERTFRNPSGVYMKLMNFYSLDPRYTGTGMANSSVADRTVFEEYWDRPIELEKIANGILSSSKNSRNFTNSILDDMTTEAPEGRILTRSHQSRERDPKLVKDKKQIVFHIMGRLSCEVCNFDFRDNYGEQGVGFMECHHIKPLRDYGDGEMTRIEDLALLCANCHRMIHRSKPWLSVAELRELVLNNGRNYEIREYA